MKQCLVIKVEENGKHRTWNCQLEAGHEGRHRSITGHRVWDDLPDPVAPSPPITSVEDALLALEEIKDHLFESVQVMVDERCEEIQRVIDCLSKLEL